MFTEEFGHELLRKYVSMFGNLFNNIYVSRSDGTDAKAQRFKVPISYAPREKFLAITEQKPNSKVQSVILPRMSFDIVGLLPDSQRRMQGHIRHHEQTGVVAEPSPWIINFELNIIVKNNLDGMRIIEQILPYFNPKLSVTAQLIENLERTWDIDIVFDSITHDDSYEGDFESKRVVTWTLQFSMKAFMVKPVVSRKLIKFIRVNMFNSMDGTQGGLTITTQPGLTANGQPTRDINETIPYMDVDPDDPYDYIVQVEDI